MPSLACNEPDAMPRHGRTRRIAAGEVPPALFAAAMALFAAAQFLSGLTMPLSMDEGFSAVIAAQPDLANLVRWCLAELSGPVHYSILWGWEKLAGDSNVALRLPGLAFALAAPWLLWAKGPGDLATRALWTVIVALWVPTLSIGTAVRPYSLILLLACAQAIAFLRLIEAPDTRRAMLWTGLSALAVLTHYHAAVIGGLQGLAFVGIWRMRAVRCWPALLPLVPMAGWMTWHLPLLLKFGGSGGWYLPLGFADFVYIPSVFFGGAIFGAMLTAAIVTTFYAQLRQGPATRRLRFEASTAELALAASGVGAFAVVLAIGFVWPSFVPRYLIAYAPAMLFIVPLWLRAVARAVPAAPTLIVLAAMASATVSVADRIAHPEYTLGHSFSVERPSRWIAQQGGAERLVFFWDNPTAALANPARMAEVGGYFLAREGPAAEVVIPRYPAGGDPNPAVERLAQGGGAVIWIYDTKVPRTMSARFPPKMRQDRANWTCRDFGGGNIFVLACVPRKAAGSAGRPAGVR